jgi:hypothetical protein
MPTDSHAALRARLEQAICDLVLAQQGWQEIVEIPTLRAGQQNLIELLREAAARLAPEDDTTTKKSTTTKTDLGFLGSSVRAGLDA